mmetsp:Transcript_29739/g.91043  ORF Transcript_29739/g.91043 Transcript_29739/m.91043 type:complete len:247 (-) Transcript_29739:718-1458(-)
MTAILGVVRSVARHRTTAAPGTRQPAALFSSSFVVVLLLKSCVTTVQWRPRLSLLRSWREVDEDGDGRGVDAEADAGEDEGRRRGGIDEVDVEVREELGDHHFNLTPRELAARAHRGAGAERQHAAVLPVGVIHVPVRVEGAGVGKLGGVEVGEGREHCDAVAGADLEGLLRLCRGDGRGSLGVAHHHRTGGQAEGLRDDPVQKDPGVRFTVAAFGADFVDERRLLQHVEQRPEGCCHQVRDRAPQ